LTFNGVEQPPAASRDYSSTPSTSRFLVTTIDEYLRNLPHVRPTPATASYRE
jgi:hypothetical protein